MFIDDVTAYGSSVHSCTFCTFCSNSATLIGQNVTVQMDNNHSKDKEMAESVKPNEQPKLSLTGDKTEGRKTHKQVAAEGG